MQIKNDFEVPLPPPSAWSLLMNVPLTAACFPGAELVDSIDEDHYKGRVTVKLGPVTMVFADNLRAQIQAAPPAPGETRTPHEIPPAQTEISVLALLWQAFVARLKRILA